MERIAINKHTALKMFWDAGYSNESYLRFANNLLAMLEQPSPGYYFADAVSDSIEYNLETIQ